MIIKCTQCGNTFTREVPIDQDIITCPICEAEYIAQIKQGKLKLKEYVFEENDLGQL